MATGAPNRVALAAVQKGSPAVGTEAGTRTGPTRSDARPGLEPGVGVQAIRQPAYGQGIVVSVLVTLLVFVLALLGFGDGDGTGRPLAQTTTWLFWGLAAIVVLAAGVGAQFAERSAAQAAAAVGHPRPETAMATAWAVPTVAALAAVLLVATYHNRWMLLCGPVIAFFGTAGSLLSRDLLDDAADATHRTATTIHTLVVHAIAFLALGAVYYNKLPTWLTAPLVGFIGGALVLETLERGDLTPVRRGAYALLGAVAMFEAALAVAWWPTHGWTGGAVLLVCFYLVAGVILARCQRSVVRSRDLIEFGLVSLVALAVLAATA